MNKILFVSFLVFIIDYIWILLVMKDQYTKMVPNIQNSPMDIRILSAIISYIFIIFSIITLVLPNIKKQTLLIDSLYYGGLTGLASYGMFSFTNYAIFKNWSLKVVLLDTIWGFILFSLVTYIYSYYS